jgi:transposase-like protein
MESWKISEKWNDKYQMIYRSRQRSRDDLGWYFKYKSKICHAVYTTNTIESFDYQ